MKGTVAAAVRPAEENAAVEPASSRILSGRTRRMQSESSAPGDLSDPANRARWLALAVLLPAGAGAVRRPAAGWAGRTGAAVTVGPSAPDADVVIVPPAEVGAWAAKDDARAVPKAVQADDHAARWSRILFTYRDRLTTWGRE